MAENISKEDIIKRLPSYLYPYIGVTPESGNLSGFWGDLWGGVESGASTAWNWIKSGASYVGEGAEKGLDYLKTGAEKGWDYTKEGASWSWDKLRKLYNNMFKYNNNHSEMVQKGASNIAANHTNILRKSLTHAKNSGASESWLSKIGKSIGNVIGRVTNDVTQYGAQVYAQKLKQKIAKAAKITGQSENEIYNKTLAWSIKHENELKSMGFSTPEAATTAVLEHTNGMPPKPGETPMQVFGKSEAGILGNINPTMLALAGIAAIMFMENRKHDKHNK